MKKDYVEFREKAIAWLNANPKKKTFAEGLSILIGSGFKPVISGKLSKLGETAFSKEKLEVTLREFIRVWARPEQLESTPTLPKKEPVSKKKDQNPATNTGKGDLPAEVALLIDQFGRMYNERSILHNLLHEVGESNDEASEEKRADLLEKMDSLSERMDQLHALRVKFEEENVIPSFDDIQAIVSAKNVDPSSDLASLSLDELNKLLKSEKTKRLRAQNMLDFQTETKADVPNPIAEGSPKFVKYAEKIKALNIRIEEIESAIANAIKS